VGGKLQPGDDACEARWVSRQELKQLEVNQSTLQVLRQVVNFDS
jgi:hypothetical protein